MLVEAKEVAGAEMAPTIVSSENLDTPFIPDDRFISVYCNVPVDYDLSMDDALGDPKKGGYFHRRKINSENFRNVYSGEDRLTFYLVKIPTKVSDQSMINLGLRFPTWEEVMAFGNIYQGNMAPVSLYPVLTYHYLGVEYDLVKGRKSCFVCKRDEVLDTEHHCLIGVPKTRPGNINYR